MKYKAYLQLMRPRHYLKNLLVFLPLIFSGLLVKPQSLLSATAAFFAFCLVASAVYIINDIRDQKADRLHPKKKRRPIASGAINTTQAIILMIVLLGLAILLQAIAHFSITGFALLGAYVLINLFYSFGLKDIPIVDVGILSLGFVMRVFYGADAIGVVVSSWLYLAVLAFSFYVSLGKRRNEIKIPGHRKVNRHYSQQFLDKNMYVCLGLTILYYSLWAIDVSKTHVLMFLTVPVLIVIIMTYSLAVESAESDGDPVNIVMSSKPLLGLIVFYGLLMTGLIYL